MKFIKRILTCVVLLGIMANFCIFYEVQAVSRSTGIGLSAHCIRAYNENWQYSYGSASEGYVDCSGLIWSYNGVGGNRCNMLGASTEWGYVSNGIPRIHGLGLHQPGHVGVYIGSNQAIDARDYGINCVLHNPYQKSWVEWFKIAGVEYPNNGWVLLDGKAYYYENGQYIVDTQRIFNDITYTFNSVGISDILPPDDVYTETDYNNDNRLGKIAELGINKNSFEEINNTYESNNSNEEYNILENNVVENNVVENNVVENNVVENNVNIIESVENRDEANNVITNVEDNAHNESSVNKEKIEMKQYEKEEVKKEKSDKGTIKEEQDKKERTEEERKLALKREEENRIEREIIERKKVLNKRKRLLQFKKIIYNINESNGLGVKEDNFYESNVLVIKNDTLNNDIKINNIDYENNINNIIDNIIIIVSYGDKEKVWTEYMDIMYSDTFDFSNDIMAYRYKKEADNNEGDRLA